MFYFKDSTGTCDSPWLVILNITPEIKNFNSSKIIEPAYITSCFSFSREAMRVRDLAQFLFYKLEYHTNLLVTPSSGILNHNR